MGTHVKKTHIITGLLAHVDAGKTTLSEALLYQTGTKRTFGRVDHKTAFLDTHSLEQERGITIFSKQALFSTQRLSVTLLDTPGHADFGSEAERVLPVLDCAVLVISGTDGVQAHTMTLWKLLERYHVPVFLFINKMDLPVKSKEELLAHLQRTLSAGCTDFFCDYDALAEQAALCDEALLENFLASGTITKANIRELIRSRKIFPCCFGSALKLTGVTELIQLLDDYVPTLEYPDTFGAMVYKISRDTQGNRLTWIKVTGGSLSVRSLITYQDLQGDRHEEKVVQLRLYSGDKFTAVEQAAAGTICAVTGLSATYAGQGLGDSPHAAKAMLEPVMTWRLRLPAGCDPVTVLPKLRQLEEEDPQLHIFWDSRLQQIHMQIMGQVQQEVICQLIRQRFGIEATLDDRRIYYKETIESIVEGVGHFEPLRHYAEVHLLLEPLPRGSGLLFDTACPIDVLEAGYQNLVLTHLSERQHLGVLTGSPITDMKITLLVGKAHLKHTEGGDFRQATYRAVRQGLMQARCVLLEPWYRFTLTVPTEQIGRAITDIRTMCGSFDPPESAGVMSTLKGIVPAGELSDYAQQVAAYTQGRGQLQVTLDGYAPCHDQQAVIAGIGYDPEADVENTPDSVFCSHGAGHTVKWDQVKEFMHMSSGLQEDKPAQPALLTRNLRIDEKELEAIMQREFGPVKRPLYHAPANRAATETLTIKPPQQQYLIVDGYNIIFSWEDLAETARHDMDAARRQLIDCLSSYAGFKKCRVVLVFDGYQVKGNPGEKSSVCDMHVVYTKEGETADNYIESLLSKIGKNYSVRVATSDALVQLSSLRSGVLRVSARELQETILAAQKEMRHHYKN